jgi:hypothetical protein
LAQGSVDVTPSLLYSLRKKEQSGLACAIKRYADFLGCEIATKKARSRPENRVRKGQGQP